MNVTRMGISLFQVMNFLIRSVIIIEEVRARMPERVVASPREGIRKGRIVIMKMPNPKPVVRWTKLAPMQRRKI